MYRAMFKLSRLASKWSAQFDSAVRGILVNLDGVMEVSAALRCLHGLLDLALAQHLHVHGQTGTHSVHLCLMLWAVSGDSHEPRQFKP